MSIEVLNEFLPPAEEIRKGAIKVGETLGIDSNDVLNVDSSVVLGTYYSNCITEIPQNIKYTLNNGVLTIKAGTKTYIPDGFEEDGITKKFREYIVTQDTSYPISHVTGTSRLVAISDSNDTYGYLAHYWFSGDTAPIVGGTCGWYDTVNNVIKISSSDGSSWSTPNVSLPLLGGAYTKDYGFNSIDNVFNGAGYVGHHAFVLPGVKGLIANGKTDKSTVKSILKEVETVYTLDLSSGGVYTYNNAYITLNTSTNLGRIWYKSCTEASELQPLEGYIQYAYDTNTTYRWNTSTSTYDTVLELPFVNTSMKDSQITYFNILQPIRIANANETLDTTGTFLFDYKWTDHAPNKLSWADASTFSWLDGNIYKAAYDELLTAWNGNYTARTDNGITYRDTEKGYQIAGADQEANIVSTWTAQHTAWFYILDTANHRFKLPRLASKQIVETWQNSTGKSGYRIYADDWVENWGWHDYGSLVKDWNTVTITYPIPFKENNYCLLTQAGRNDSATGGINNQSFIINRTTTTFKTEVYGDGNSQYFWWSAKGFSTINYAASDNQSVTRPFKRLYFYLGYTDINDTKQSEVDVSLVTSNNIAQINTETEAGIQRIITASNALNRTQISNCITEIPQDIKLELNNSAITIKAGSKLYIPNGFETDGTTRHFDTVTLTGDITKSIAFSGTYTDVTICYRNGDFIYRRMPNETASGDTDTCTAASHFWYDLANNVIKYTTDSKATYTSGWSFPIGLFSNKAASITAINQIFNGFGYIGATAYILPGLKGLYGDGINEDGSLRSLETTIPTVRITTRTWSTTGKQSVFLYNDVPVIENKYIEANHEPNVTDHWTVWYSPLTNTTKVTLDDNLWHDIRAIHLFAAGANGTANITDSYYERESFRAVDYSSADYVIDYKLPTDNDPNWYRRYKSGWLEQGGRTTSVAEASHVFTFPYPFKTTQYWVHATNDQVTDAGINVYAFRPLSTTQCYLVSAYNGTFYAEYMHWTACGY